MISKIEQTNYAIASIRKQADDLVNKYGWDKKHVEIKADELINHAKNEIEKYGSDENLSDAWNLARWINPIIWHRSNELNDCKYNNKTIVEFNGIADSIIEELSYIDYVKIKTFNIKIVEHVSVTSNEELPHYRIYSNIDNKTYGVLVNAFDVKRYNDEHGIRATTDKMIKMLLKYEIES